LLDRTAAETKKFAEEFAAASPKSRNAALAGLDAILCGIKSGEMTKDDLLPACQKYIDNHIHKLYAFNDIRRIIGPDRDGLAKMLDYILVTHAVEEKVFILD
jgi:N-terminal acetyltransferase B complex non-catalytic subunit